MNTLKKYLPYIVAILHFFIITYLYFSPVFEGKSFPQGDTTQWKWSAQEANEYRADHGKTPFWNSRMFGGMPGYQVTQVEGNNHTKKLLNWLPIPHPANKFFVLMLFSFFMFTCFKVNPWISMLGAFAFAFSTYNLILLEAGHNTKVNAIAYAPLVIGGVALLFRKKYLAGTAIVAAGMGLQIGANHVQITYYLGMILVAWFISEFFTNKKSNNLKHYFIVASLAVSGALVGLASNAVNLMLTQEYSNETIRGKTELTITPDKKEKSEISSGLDRDYAFTWSQGFVDVPTFIIPYMAGGSGRENIGKKSETYKRLKEMRQPGAKQIAENFPGYWGALPFTSGPEYFGAIIIFLFVLGMFTLDGKYKWWILTMFALSMIMSMGKNFGIVNNLLFDYFPLYNKFRSVNMAQVIAQIVAPILAVLSLQHYITSDLTAEVKKQQLLKALYVTGGFVLFVLITAGMYDMSSAQDERFGAIIDEILADRLSMLRTDAARSLFFIGVAFGALFAFIKGKISPNIAVATITVFVIIDLWLIDFRYLDHKAFVKPKKMQETFEPSAIDKQILTDKSNYRVFDATVNAFNNARVCNFHRSIGGYHAAKLRRFQDVVDFHIVKNNMKILDMLNTKYYIQKDQESGKEFVSINNNASGNAWFVNSIKYVPGPDEEILALTDFNPKNEAIVDERYKSQTSDVSLQIDSNASIAMTYFSPDTVKYTSNSTQKHLAVFSEIYYNSGKGWNAYVNGKKVDHLRCNYILRGLAIPAGENDITFIFEPQSYRTGIQLANASGIITYLLLLGALVMGIKSMFNKVEEQPDV